MRSFLLIMSMFIFLNASTANYAQPVEKKTIAVIDLETRGATTTAEAITLTDRLRSILVRTRVFNVVDRGKMQAILQEVGFQQTGCTSTECAVEMGRILNVQQMIAGSIGKIGSLYTIDIVAIDVESSQINKSFTRDYKGQIEGLIGIMADIARQLAGQKTQTTQKAPEVGSLYLIGQPEFVEVFLDGKSIGTTPLKKENIDVGEHDLSFQAEGYKAKKRKITIEKGKASKYKIVLDKKGGSGKWWVLGTTTVAAAGGAAYYFLYMKEDETPEEAGMPTPPGRP